MCLSYGIYMVLIIILFQYRVHTRDLFKIPNNIPMVSRVWLNHYNTLFYMQQIISIFFEV